MNTRFLVKTVIALCLLLGAYHTSCSATTPGDSTLKCLLKSDIGFHSDLEERVMKKLFAGEEVSLLEMMLATDKYTLLTDYEKINQRVEAFIEKMKHETKTLPLQNKVR